MNGLDGRTGVHARCVSFAAERGAPLPTGGRLARLPWGAGRTSGTKWAVLGRCLLVSLIAQMALTRHVMAQAAEKAKEVGQPASAVEASDPPAEKKTSPAEILSDEQSRLADKYRRLEELIFKMADFEATSNPRRAALLKQAYKQSKDRLTLSQLNGIVTLLASRQYKLAIEGQTGADKDLRALLELLLSENRSDRLKSETERIKDYIKELKKIERLQRSVRGRTEGGADTHDLSKSQEKVADRTGDLGKQIEQDGAPAGGDPDKSQPGDQRDDSKKDPSKQDDPSKEPGDEKKEPTGDQEKKDSKNSPDGQKKNGDKSSGKKKSDGKPDDKKSSPKGKPEDGKPSQGKPKDGKPQGDAKSKSGKKSPSSQQGKPQQGKSGEPGEAQEQPPQQQQEQENPAQKKIREAEQKMREAQQRLEEARRSESVEKQTEALEKLQEAIAELEEILRQMREEEIGRMLALLEGRFRKMLELELKVYEGTIRLGKIPQEKRNRAVDIQSSKLSFDQRKIGVQADRCLTLLLEEGSSIAFPEVIEQMRDDMEDVGARLSQTKVERITQGLEEEIILTLEELIAALQKAQQDLDKDSKSRPSRPSQASDPPLVDELAELKMIRSLQYRVNKRTERYSRLLDDVEDAIGQATDSDLRDAITKLAEREARIQQITRDIVLGKNK